MTTKHAHSHSCQCEHVRVRYCRHCSTVYCLGCSQEWSAKTVWSTSNIYNTQPTFWPPYNQALTSSGAGGLRAEPAVTFAASTPCDHSSE